jgi:hypothetical protein
VAKKYRESIRRAKCLQVQMKSKKQISLNSILLSNLIIQGLLRQGRTFIRRILWHQLKSRFNLSHLHSFLHYMPHQKPRILSNTSIALKSLSNLNNNSNAILFYKLLGVLTLPLSHLTFKLRISVQRRQVKYHRLHLFMETSCFTEDL